MPLKPNLIERLLLRIGVIPTVLLDTGVSMFQASALLTAGDIGLFTHLKGGPLSLNEIKARTHTSLHGLSVLLTCMVNLGYVDQKADEYRLSKATRRSFPIDLFPEMVPFFRAVNEKLNQATEAVNMDPEGGIMGWDMVKGGEVGRSYQAAMRWLGSSMVKEVASHIQFGASPKTMLDVGGSHALYCVEFCRRYAGLRATVLDWPIGLDNATTTLAAERDVAPRIDLAEGDFEKGDLPGRGYDFVFLGNIVHGLREEANQLLFRKIAAVTSSGATISILDQYSNVRGSAFVKGVASLIGWNLFLFAGGRAYDFDVLAKWLNDAGFGFAKLTHLSRSPGFSLITARKN
jgi:O-methyltransferase domain